MAGIFVSGQWSVVSGQLFVGYNQGFTSDAKHKLTTDQSNNIREPVLDFAEVDTAGGE